VVSSGSHSVPDGIVLLCIGDQWSFLGLIGCSDCEDEWLVHLHGDACMLLTYNTGTAGLEGWRWIFILEGIATVAMGVAVFFLLPDSPDHAAGRWLTHDEARFLRLSHIHTRGLKRERRINADGKKEKVKWGVLGQVAKDWQIYLQAMIFASNAVPNYGLKFTMPQILKNSKLM
jgi:hypothetical protein